MPRPAACGPTYSEAGRCCGYQGSPLDGVRAADDPQLAGPDGLAAGGADRQRVKLGAAGVREDDRLLARVAAPVAPLLQGQHDRTELLARGREVVLVAHGALRVGPALDQADLLEPAQARGEHVARGAGVARQLAEAAVAVADLADDEQRVAVAHDGQRIGY